MSRKKRDDIHRVGAFVPAHYDYVMSYSMPTTSLGRPVPGFRVCCKEHTPEQLAAGKCCIFSLRASGAKFAEHGGQGKCTACGAWFIEGDVWRHTPTGEHIHLGHNCVDKYSMMVDRSEYELARGREMAAAAMQITRARNAEKRTEFLSKHPGLAEALETDHYIIRSISNKFTHYCDLSEKQIALVFKLDAEAKAPKPPEEVLAQAPTGKQVFVGQIVSSKVHEGQWGNSIKMTVKVTGEAGAWIAWGTAPAALLDKARDLGVSLRGLNIEVSADLQSGDNPHFVFMKRPKAKILGLVQEIAPRNENT